MRTRVFHTAFKKGEAVYYFPLEERHNHVIGVSSDGKKIEVNEHNELMSSIPCRKEILEEFKKEMSEVNSIMKYEPYKSCLYFYEAPKDLPEDMNDWI